MAVYFTSATYHGDTVEISTERIAQYEYREKTGEHMIYVPGIGEFASTDIEELEKVFGQISGTIGLEKFKMSRPDFDVDEAIKGAGNSGTH